MLKLHHFSRLQVDSENLKNQADKIKAEAERIADDAERLMSDNQGLIQESYDRRTRLKDDLLERYNNISSLSSRVLPLSSWLFECLECSVYFSK